MKTPEEILFDKMQPDEEGKIIPLTEYDVLRLFRRGNAVGYRLEGNEFARYFNM